LAQARFVPAARRPAPGLSASRSVVCQAKGRRGKRGQNKPVEDGEPETKKEEEEPKVEEVAEEVETKAEAEEVVAEVKEVVEEVVEKVEEVVEKAVEQVEEAVETVEPVAEDATASEEVEYDYDFGDYEETVTNDDLKNILLDTVLPTNRGFDASSEVRAEVNELIAQLEAANPTASPTQELALIEGTWRLVYTSNSELTFFLAADRLPMLTIGEIFQNIDVGAGTVENKLEVMTPLARQTVSATAEFEVQSPKRLQVKFVQGKLPPPQLTALEPLPPSIDLGGNSLDLTPFQDVADKLQSLLKPGIEQANKALETAPVLDIPLDAQGGAESWLLTTYLDEDLRIARGDAGSVFVLVKAVSA